MVRVTTRGFEIECARWSCRVERGDCYVRVGTFTATVLWGPCPRTGGLFLEGADWSWHRNWAGYVVAVDHEDGRLARERQAWPGLHVVG